MGVIVHVLNFLSSFDGLLDGCAFHFGAGVAFIFRLLVFRLDSVLLASGLCGLIFLVALRGVVGTLGFPAFLAVPRVALPRVLASAWNRRSFLSTVRQLGYRHFRQTGSGRCRGSEAGVVRHGKIEVAVHV